jgi:hypothetical protein
MCEVALLVEVGRDEPEGVDNVVYLRSTLLKSLGLLFG